MKIMFFLDFYSARDKVLPKLARAHTMLPVRETGTRYNGGDGKRSKLPRKLPPGTGQGVSRYLFKILLSQTG